LLIVYVEFKATLLSQFESSRSRSRRVFAQILAALVEFVMRSCSSPRLDVVGSLICRDQTCLLQASQLVSHSFM
jgi:hypothetical protein